MGLKKDVVTLFRTLSFAPPTPTHHPFIRPCNAHGLQSQKGAELLWRYPIVMDAVASETQRQGDSMMSRWAGGDMGPAWTAQC